jgi:glycine cleavage system H protein
VNPALNDTPDVVNKDPYGKGWMVKIKITDSAELKELLSPEKYKAIL